ncbi:hypothetical protein LTSEMIN_2398, partial [Salmonella enterica subsp. enterica serovar Minnesota str. A4-603]
MPMGTASFSKQTGTGRTDTANVTNDAVGPH